MATAVSELPKCAAQVYEHLPSWALKEIAHGDMVTVKLKVTPAIATQWLEGNTHNRPLGGQLVNELRGHIDAGTWRLTHQGIAFSPDSVLIDGQHRLWAVIEANKAVEMHATFNEPMENQEFIDTNRARTPVDRMKLSGYEWINTYHTGVITMIAKVNPVFENGENGSSRRLRTDEIKWYADRYQEGLRFVTDAIAGRKIRGVTTVSVLTPCVRAFYHKDSNRVRLSEFMTVLCTGLANGPADSACVLLRNQLLRNFDSHNRLTAAAVYYRAENALAAFFKNEKLQVLRPVERELFRMPHELQGTGPGAVARAVPRKAVKTKGRER